jgi:hypothetical protein
MKTSFLLVFVTSFALPSAPALFAEHPASSLSAPVAGVFAESEEEEHDAGPPDDVVRKLGAMSADQKFNRGTATESDGKVAPKATTVYPVDITDAEGKSVLKLFFFKGDSGKWSVFDEAGNVMHET